MGSPPRSREQVATREGADRVTSEIMREVAVVDVVAELQDPDSAIVFVVAPNFEDRSVHSADWLAAQEVAGRLAMQVLWFQTPGVDDIFDRIKADNRDRVLAQFKHLDSCLAATRVDLPATDVNIVLGRLRRLANEVGGRATLVLDISSIPRAVVRLLIDALSRVNGGVPERPFDRILCLYSAASEYPQGVDSDMIGGVLGYFTDRSIYDLISTAGILEAVVSLAGTSHDSAQTLDALWEHGLRARTSISAIAYMNRSNMVYSYERLARAAWVLNKAKINDTEMIYAFELGDAVRHIFERTDRALEHHMDYRRAGGEGIPTYLVGGFGPKPIGLAALLASMRYEHVMSRQKLPATSDVLQVRGSQYTTRYSHGVSELRCFEINFDCLYTPLTQGP